MPNASNTGRSNGSRKILNRYHSRYNRTSGIVRKGLCVCQDSSIPNVDFWRNQIDNADGGAEANASGISNPEEAIGEKFGVLSFAWCVWGFVTYLFDYGSDIALALTYYVNGHPWWFGWTLAFIVIPGLILTGFSILWTFDDIRVHRQSCKLNRGEESECQKECCQRSKSFWFFRITIWVLQMSPIIYFWKCITHGVKSRKNSESSAKLSNYLMYIYSDVDATMLRLFEALFEAAPQLILQLYIVFGHHHCDGEWQWYRTNECSNSSNSTQLDMNSPFPLEDVSPTWPLRWLNLRLNTFQGGLQVISMITSWVSLGFAMVSFQRALRASQQPTKQRLSVCAWVMQFFWYFSFIGSRIFVIVLLFLISGVIGAAFCFLHCALMFMWLTQQRTTFCAEVFHVREIGYRICVSIVYLFCFFNVVDHPTFLKYVLYYILAFVENGAVLGIWYVLKDYEPEVLYRDYAVVLVTVLSVIGPLLFQLPYYFWCHPEIGNWERVKRGKEPISLRDRLLRFSTGFPVRRSAAAFHATDDAVNFRMCSSNEKCSAKSTAKLMPV